MFASLLITLREGLEAALILGIILAYLARTGHRDRFAPVWLGTALAIAVSLLVGAAVFVTVGELEGSTEQIFEGGAMFLAVVMLSYMIVWMKQQAAGLRADLQERVREALRSESSLALIALAFIVVVREGVETALFLFASTRTSTPAESTVGGLLGLALAVALGYSIYRGSRRLNLRAFFNFTGVLMIFFAAGLLAHGIHEFHEASLVPPLVEHVWDINWLLHEKSTTGRFLTALAGFDGNPSLVEVLAYVAYLAATLTYFFRPRSLRSSQTSTRPQRAA